MNEKIRPTFFLTMLWFYRNFREAMKRAIIFYRHWLLMTHYLLFFLPSRILHVDSLLTLLLPFIHVTVGEISHNHTFDMILIEILSPLLHWNARRWILLTITNNAYLFVSDDDEWQFQGGANTLLVEERSVFEDQKRWAHNTEAREPKKYNGGAFW